MIQMVDVFYVRKNTKVYENDIHFIGRAAGWHIHFKGIRENGLSYIEWMVPMYVGAPAYSGLRPCLQGHTIFET